MRTNGFIYPVRLTEPEGGYVTFDERGFPVVDKSDPSAADCGEGVECWAQTNTDEAAGAYEDGEFRRCAFTVLIDSFYDFAARAVRLVKDGEEMGVFRVMQSQRLSRMGRTTLMLRQ